MLTSNALHWLIKLVELTTKIKFSTIHQWILLTNTMVNKCWPLLWSINVALFSALHVRRSNNMLCTKCSDHLALRAGPAPPWGWRRGFYFQEQVTLTPTGWGPWDVRHVRGLLLLLHHRHLNWRIIVVSFASCRTENGPRCSCWYCFSKIRSPTPFYISKLHITVSLSRAPTVSCSSSVLHPF
jgi:hypothetical protein